MEDASPELLDRDDDNSDEELYHDNVDILFYLFFVSFVTHCFSSFSLMCNML